MSTESASCITLKMGDLPLLQRALNALDGRAKAVPVKSADKASPENQIVFDPYVFGGKTRLRIAKWVAWVKIQVEALNKAHEGLVKQYSKPAEGCSEDGSASDAPDEPAEVGAAAPQNEAMAVHPSNNRAFYDEWSAAQESEVKAPAELLKLSYDDLKAEDNRLPPSVLGALAPILSE